jgi:hypothetical protein
MALNEADRHDLSCRRAWSGVLWGVVPGASRRSSSAGVDFMKPFRPKFMDKTTLRRSTLGL